MGEGLAGKTRRGSSWPMELNSSLKMTQNLEQIKYFDEKLEAESNTPLPNLEKVQFYRSQIDKLTSPSIPQLQAGKFTFSRLFSILNHILYTICITFYFDPRFYLVALTLNAEEIASAIAFHLKKQTHRKKQLSALSSTELNAFPYATFCFSDQYWTSHVRISPEYIRVKEDVQAYKENLEEVIATHTANANEVHFFQPLTTTLLDNILGIYSFHENIEMMCSGKGFEF
jgi:hypothetical protein